MARITMVFLTLVAVAYGADQDTAAASTVEKRGITSAAYGAPAKQVSSAFGAPSHGGAAVAAFKTTGPIGYSNSIPAAAIRNVETVGVTKTITPVVTKTTTYNTHSEPALSVGHVQGYSQSAVGSPKIAPVQFNTQYTTYANPTVGVNGPVTYTGPAVATIGYGVAGGQSFAAVPVQSYGVAAQSYGVPAQSYGVAAQSYGYAPQQYVQAYSAPASAYASVPYAGLQGAYSFQQPLQYAPISYVQQGSAVQPHAYATLGQQGNPAAGVVVSSHTYAAPSVTTYSAGKGYSHAHSIKH